MSEYLVYIINGTMVRYMVDEWDKDEKEGQEKPKKVTSHRTDRPVEPAKEKERE